MEEKCVRPRITPLEHLDELLEEARQAFLQTKALEEALQEAMGPCEEIKWSTSLSTRRDGQVCWPVSKEPAPKTCALPSAPVQWYEITDTDQGLRLSAPFEDEKQMRECFEAEYNTACSKLSEHAPPMRLQACDAALAPLKTGIERLQGHIRAQWELQQRIVDGCARALLAHASAGGEGLPRKPDEPLSERALRYRRRRTELVQPWLLRESRSRDRLPVSSLDLSAPARPGETLVFSGASLLSSFDLSAPWLLEALSEEHSEAEIIGYECQNLLTLCVNGKAPEAMMSVRALAIHCAAPAVLSHGALHGLLSHLRKAASVFSKLRDFDARRAAYEINQAVYFQEGRMPGVDEITGSGRDTSNADQQWEKRKRRLAATLLARNGEGGLVMHPRWSGEDQTELFFELATRDERVSGAYAAENLVKNFQDRMGEQFPYGRGTKKWVPVAKAWAEAEKHISVSIKPL